uniref:CHK kinase-like domain-containing protein n=1 Tax=Heliothis virescens TaxID=7102 RepID=A0A2A4K1F1_HELVI
MAQYNFEGEIQNINERQLEFINSVIEKQGFKNSKVTFNAVGSAGDNYVANVKRIIVEGENGNLSIIAKIAPASEHIRDNFHSATLFNNECFMYAKVLPKFSQLQKQAGVPEEEQIKFPKCYGSLNEAPNEIILLEDVKAKGYTMLDRFIPLTDYVVKSVLKSLAVWHSLSYVLKQKEPETYNYFKDNLIDFYEILARKEEYNPAAAFISQIDKMAVGVLADYPEYQNIIKDKATDSLERAARLQKVENGSRFAVLHHGDAWTNNIMFQFQGDTLKEAMLIDYQLARNSSPVSDLMYFIFNCTHHNARVEHFYEWLDYYHSELDNALSNYGIKANYAYPRDQLDADIKRYSKVALGNAIVSISMTGLKPEEASKVKEQMDSADISNVSSVNSMDTASLSDYKKKLLGLLESFNRFGLL